MTTPTHEQKLAQAFKIFFERTVSPYLSHNETVMNEWKYFHRLISTDPIDISQI